MRILSVGQQHRRRVVFILAFRLVLVACCRPHSRYYMTKPASHTIHDLIICSYHEDSRGRIAAYLSIRLCIDRRSVGGVDYDYYETKKSRRSKVF